MWFRYSRYLLLYLLITLFITFAVADFNLQSLYLHYIAIIWPIGGGQLTSPKSGSTRAVLNFGASSELPVLIVLVLLHC